MYPDPAVAHEAQVSADKQKALAVFRSPTAQLTRYDVANGAGMPLHRADDALFGLVNSGILKVESGAFRKAGGW